MTEEHVHQAVFLGDFQGELGGLFPVRWCSDCGTVILFRGRYKFLMIPDRARDYVSSKTDLRYVPQERPRDPPARVLGRSFKELMQKAASTSTYNPFKDKKR